MAPAGLRGYDRKTAMAGSQAKDMLDQLRANFTAQITDVRQEVITLTDRLNTAEEKIAQQDKAIEYQAETIRKMEERNDSLNATVSRLMSAVNNLRPLRTELELDATSDELDTLRAFVGSCIVDVEHLIYSTPGSKEYDAARRRIIKRVSEAKAYVTPPKKAAAND
jgi:chromosome segregation ATPase